MCGPHSDRVPSERCTPASARAARARHRDGHGRHDLPTAPTKLAPPIVMSSSIGQASWPPGRQRKRGPTSAVLQHVRLDVVFAAGLEALRRWSQKNGEGWLIGAGAARSSGREAVVARAGACPGLATADVRRADMALRLPACARTHGRLAGVARDVGSGHLCPGGGRGVSSRSCVHRDIHIGRLHRPDGRGMSSGLAHVWLLDRVGGGCRRRNGSAA